MKIHTTSGDGGQTRDASGRGISKNSPQPNALGSLDELNSYLGLCLCQCSEQKQQDVREALSQFQPQLLSLGVALSGTNSDGLDESVVTRMEQVIDDACAKMPALTEFIIPGGCELACNLHVARAVCRRAERAIVALAESGVSVETIVLRYINRLGDLLFVLARMANRNAGAGETTWKP